MPKRFPRPQSVIGVELSDLLVSFPAIKSAEVPANLTVRITGVALASHAVHPGDLYIALPGSRFHGADFATQAAAAGAVAILTEAGGVQRAATTGLPVLVTEGPRALAGEVASLVFGHPSQALTVVGITGTNGKTTTTYLVEAALRAAGHKTAVIGTVENRIGAETFPTERTNPEASELHALLACAVEQGVTTVVMETSSHALVLHRVTGVRFAIAAFTNLSVDHLDLHSTMEEYFRAKALFFDGRANTEIITVDDSAGQRLAAIRPKATTVSAQGNPSADWKALDQKFSRFSQTFTVSGPNGISAPASISLPGQFNVANALLAISIAVNLGVDLTTAISGVAGVSEVPGRMEKVVANSAETSDILAIVDFAHAPDGVVKALAALRPITAGRLICLLGCGGDRDTTKRPAMGEAAARGADIFIATDDNPRSEDPALVRSAMLKGSYAVPQSERADIVEIGDRAEAIAHAVSIARPGDTIAVLGKGHEAGQEIAGVKHPFDDREVLATALRTVR